jgi:hypothetical protein
VVADLPPLLTIRITVAQAERLRTVGEEAWGEAHDEPDRSELRELLTDIGIPLERARARLRGRADG